MYDYKNAFKQDFLSTVGKVLEKTWIKIIGGYGIYMVASIILMILIVFGLLDLKSFNFENLQNNPQEFVRYIETLQPEILNPKFILFGFIMFIILLILGAWLYNFSIIVANQQITNDEADFSLAFSSSWDGRIIKVILAGFLIYVLLALVSIVMILLLQSSGLGIFLGLIAIGIASFKFILVVPTIVIGDKQVGESFSYSFEHISWVRAIKFFGIAILVTISMFIVLLIIAFISMIFSFIPIIGQVIQIGMQLMIGGTMTALVAIILAGLYYRYLDDEFSDELTTDTFDSNFPDSSPTSEI